MVKEASCQIDIKEIQLMSSDIENWMVVL